MGLGFAEYFAVAGVHVILSDATLKLTQESHERGPFQIADMAELDTNVSVLETLERDLGEIQGSNCTAQLDRARMHMVEQGCTGTKSGAGFRTCADEERKCLLLERDHRYAALNQLLSDLNLRGPQEYKKY